MQSRLLTQSLIFKHIRFKSSNEFTPKIKKVGISLLNDAHYNKALAFSLKERQILGIHGLLPAKISDAKTQIELLKLKIQDKEDDLQRYSFLRSIAIFNRRMFFKLLKENLHKYMPIIHLPTISEACLHMERVFAEGTGLFITIRDRGYIYEVLRNWPFKEVKAICVTNGGKVLGLGDLGAHGIGICIAQVDLYTIAAGVKPEHCLAVAIDTGTDNEQFLKDPFYLGLKRKRVTGEPFYELMDEFFQACTKLYGANVLFQMQDFQFKEATYFINKYRDKYCLFNTGDQVAPAVILMGLMSASKLCKKQIHQHVYIIYGAGVAGMGIATLLTFAMIKHGLKVQEACERIWMFDKDGLITTSRIKGINSYQLPYAKNHPDETELAKVVREIKPSCLIGVSTSSGAFNETVLKSMAEFNDRPIIYALSNPNTLMECTPIDAYNHTQGKVLYACGHANPPITYGGKTYKVSSVTIVYLIPGIVLGMTVGGLKYITDDIFMIAATIASKFVTDKNLNDGLMFPEYRKIYDMSIEIAVGIIEHGFRKEINTLFPKPKDLKAYIISQQYNFDYWDYTPKTWEWR